jgi:flagellar M-ring protein FliF
MADTAPAAAATSTPLYALLPPAVKQILLLVGLAAAVAAGIALVIWSQGSNYTPLFSGLSDRDLGEVTAQLDTSGVPYKLDAGGAVLVPSDRKYDVRMQLAGAGLPRGTGFGIEEMQDKSSFGQTPFMENALYVRAVETELARTIGSMQPVESARVHLALPPQSVFLRQKREPSASVMLKLFPGRRLDKEQVQSVVNLVASSVPELLPSHVTVVDQTGALLTSSQNDSTASLTNNQFEYRKQLEQDYAQRIESLISSIVGPERVRASVSAELDFTVTEQTRESFDPNVQHVRSEQTSEDSRRGEGVQGIPGALSNQPPEIVAGGAAAAGAAAAATTNEPQSVSRSATRNFELDKTVSHTRQATGLIQRLSIGVLIDNKPPATRRGAAQPLAEAELASLTELVKQAVGFDAMRGDTISVLNSAFQPAAAVPNAPAPGFFENPAFWSIARQALGAGLVLALAWFVLRPMMSVLTRPQPIAAAPAAIEYSQGFQMMPGGRSMSLPVSYDDRMAAARSVAGQDPRQVAQVVRNWVAEDNG